MRKQALALAAIAVLSLSAGALASNRSVQPSYDALLAMPAAERKTAFRNLDGGAQLAILGMHVDRWLETNRSRLSASQIELIQQVRATLTDNRDLEKSRVLFERMRCELSRSDLSALEFPDDQMGTSSWVRDLDYWVRECVLAKAIEAMF